MTLRNYKKKTVLYFVIGLLFWLVETWAFGWNKSPLSTAEQICDYITIGIVGNVAFRFIVAEVVELINMSKEDVSTRERKVK